MNVPVRQPGKGTGTGGPPPSPPSRQAAAPNLAVWGRVCDRFNWFRSKPYMWESDQIRADWILKLQVRVGTAVTRDEPVQRDDLERLAAAAIHWASQLPDPEPKEPTQ